MKRLIIKLNQFKHYETRLRWTSRVKCGPLSVCVFFLSSFCGSLNLSVSTCLHFLVPMTPVCSIYERLAGNILYPGRKPCSVKFTPLAQFWESPVGLPKKIKIHKNIVYIKRGGGRMSWPGSTTLCCLIVFVNESVLVCEQLPCFFSLMCNKNNVPSIIIRNYCQ